MCENLTSRNLVGYLVIDAIVLSVDSCCSCGQDGSIESRSGQLPKLYKNFIFKNMVNVKIWTLNLTTQRLEKMTQSISYRFYQMLANNCFLINLNPWKIRKIHYGIFLS